jgi:hypothetical protein
MKKKAGFCIMLAIISSSLFAIDSRLVGTWYNDYGRPGIRFTEEYQTFLYQEMLDDEFSTMANISSKRELLLYNNDISGGIHTVSGDGLGNGYFGYRINISFSLLSDNKLFLIVRYSSYKGNARYENEHSYLLTKTRIDNTVEGVGKYTYDNEYGYPLPRTTPQNNGVGAYCQLQVGAFTNVENAARAFDKLKVQGFNPEYMTGGGFTRVVLKVAPNEVPSYIEKLKLIGFSNVFIQNRENR